MDAEHLSNMSGERAILQTGWHLERHKFFRQVLKLVFVCYFLQEVGCGRSCCFQVVIPAGSGGWRSSQRYQMQFTRLTSQRMYFKCWFALRY